MGELVAQYKRACEEGGFFKRRKYEQELTDAERDLQRSASEEGGKLLFNAKTQLLIVDHFSVAQLHRETRNFFGAPGIEYLKRTPMVLVGLSADDLFLELRAGTNIVHSMTCEEQTRKAVIGRLVRAIDKAEKDPNRERVTKETFSLAYREIEAVDMPSIPGQPMRGKGQTEPFIG